MSRLSVKSQRTVQILEALEKCLLEKSFRDTTIKDIAKMAGLTHGVLHYYFTSKKDILLKFINFKIEKYAAYAQEIGADGIAGLPGNKIVDEVFSFGLDLLFSNPNDVKVIIEVWSIANYDKDVLDILKVAYNLMEQLGSGMLINAGVDKKSASQITRSVIAQLTGLSLGRYLLGRDETEIYDSTRAWRLFKNPLSI